MNRRNALYVLGGTVAALAVAGVVLTRQTPKTRPVVQKPTLAVPSISQPDALKTFVAKHRNDRSLEVQDQVSAAKLRLGYSVARSEGFAKARSAFLQVARDHKGTDAQSAAFGGVVDQAAYQAVCCLAGEGKTGQARAEFEKFLRERPLSPLASAAYRRLVRLNGGESRPEWDRLLQVSVSRQEKRIRFETSVCGPKCLEKLLAEKGLVGKHDYKELAKLCGTTDSGTTVNGMQKGLRSLGIASWAYRVNRKDLSKVALPAVLLEGDHYLLLESVDRDKATVWDPRFQSAQTHPLPRLWMTLTSPRP